MNNRFILGPLGCCILFRCGMGVLVLLLALQRHIPVAAVGLVFCVWADVLIAYVARRRLWEKSDSSLQLEGMADFICFVVAPGLLAFMQVPAPSTCIALLIFILAGAYRIARFNVEGLIDGKYAGLPVTYNGYIFPLLSLIAAYTPYGMPAYFIAMMIVSAAMATRYIRIPEF